MKKLVSVCLVFIASTMLSATVNIEELAVEKCGGCHIMGVVSKEKIKNMKAPPYWAIAKKMRETFEKKEQMLKYMVDFTYEPAAQKMLFPQDSLKLFGLMPSQKGKVTEAEIAQILEYVLGDHLPEAQR